MSNSRITSLLRSLLPVHRSTLSPRARRLVHPLWWGNARRTEPISSEWGFDRGTPIDRHYIEQFLEAHRATVHGHVLEIKNRSYTTRFGSDVAHSDVLDINPDNPDATIVADLMAADAVPANQYDCFILTQTLQFVIDPGRAITHAHRILKPNGVLLVTVPAVSRVAPRYGLRTDYWRFTVAGCTALFGSIFGTGQVAVQTYGNVFTAMAFLMGSAAEELRASELQVHDAYFPVVVGVRAVKAAKMGGDDG